MRHWIAAAALVAALPATVHAEPKTITVDGCIKVEIVPQEVCLERSGCVLNPAAKTVKCTGEANDPKVREEAKRITIGPSFFSGGCATSEGKNIPC